LELLQISNYCLDKFSLWYGTDIMWPLCDEVVARFVNYCLNVKILNLQQ
jgi:hypothetical protein